MIPPTDITAEDWDEAMKEIERLRAALETAEKERDDERITLLRRARAAESSLQALRGEVDQLQKDGDEALDLLETCRSCDLVYNLNAANGFWPEGKEDDQTTVAQVVDAFLVKHRPSSAQGKVGSE